ncbi:rho GTPase-activating protein 11A [Tachyglossus aculeatus]|uniref:rho GTPase-activating protein 11A n=1 Tax=Tachyglossus aculeatus TaxID=9261 RepID=UPI0018F6C61E|nr:rho GTPase-activating protein 11A [Tachyglossus aculeatus]
MLDRQGLRPALLHYLRSAYGIKVKAGLGQPDPGKQVAAALGGKTFGTPLCTLPHVTVPEFGHVPSFLVEACTSLREHIHTEGLFRKSGSVVRLKALKSKLDQGEPCLASAPACDVAGLLKQFFRELPEPIVPAAFHEALLKAQQLAREERDTATVLLSCLMADTTIGMLRFFFSFLRSVALRSSENKMDSSNLAVVFAPTLLHLADGRAKAAAPSERKLRLQAAVVQTFIERAADIGHVPAFILEKIPSALGTEGPSLGGSEEGEWESPAEWRRRRRRSMGDMVSGALNKLKSNRTPSTPPQSERWVLPPGTPGTLTPSTKRKLPMEPSHGFSSKKRKSLRTNLNLDLCPSGPFGSSVSGSASDMSTPASVQLEASPGGRLQPSQISHSPLTISKEWLPNSSGLRRSKRVAGMSVRRVDSGKAGCFSPKISRKEKVRRSLRLRLNLGRSGRDPNGGGGAKRLESVGHRLAHQQDLAQRMGSIRTGTLFSPDTSQNPPQRGSRCSSLSEGTPPAGACPRRVPQRGSWTDLGPPACPAPRVGQPPVASLEAGSCASFKPPLPGRSPRPTAGVGAPEPEASPPGNSLTSETLLRIQKAFSQSGSDLNGLISGRATGVPAATAFCGLRDESPVEGLSLAEPPTAKDTAAVQTGVGDTVEGSQRGHGQGYRVDAPAPEVGASVWERDPSRPSHKLVSESRAQGSDRKIAPKGGSPQGLSPPPPGSLQAELPAGRPGKRSNPSTTMDPPGPVVDISKTSLDQRPVCVPLEPLGPGAPACQRPTPEAGEQPRSEPSLGAEEQAKVEPLGLGVRGKVLDHIHWFNKLSLSEASVTAPARAPLSFQRTPVRQSVRRINSLCDFPRQLGQRPPVRGRDATQAASPLVKSASCDSGLASFSDRSSAVAMARLLPRGPPVPPRGPKPVLDDLTNQDPVPAGAHRGPRAAGASPGPHRKMSGRDRARYRGSPKNPIASTRLLPSTRPVQL